MLPRVGSGGVGSEHFLADPDPGPGREFCDLLTLDPTLRLTRLDPTRGSQRVGAGRLFELKKMG